MSLKIFAMLLGILGLSCVWVGLRGYRQLVAIREIDKLGGHVVQTPVGPPWVRELVGKDRMQMFDDATFAWLDDAATDARMVHLHALTRLQGLNLDDTQVTDDGLVHLYELTRLELLRLRGTHVTDGGLIHLQRISSLQGLNFDGTQLTDAGLVHLRGLSSLKRLSLVNTKVTDAGVAALQQALPELQIER